MGVWSHEERQNQKRTCERISESSTSDNEDHREKAKVVRTCICKAGLYRIWCGVNRLGDSGVHTLSDTSAFVNPASQLLLTRRGKIRMDGAGIVVELYIAPL